MEANAAETQAAQEMSGAAMLVQALKEEGVDVLFGYPGEQCCRFTTHSTAVESATSSLDMNKAEFTLPRDMLV